MQTFKFSIPVWNKFLFSTDCDTRWMTFSLIQNKFRQSTVPCVHSKSPWLLWEKAVQTLCSQANMNSRTYQVISFLPDSTNFPLLCPPNSYSAFKTLLKFPLFCDTFSASSSSLPCTSQLSDYTLIISPMTCFVIFLFKASSHGFGRKVSWYSLFGEHFGNVYENDKARVEQHNFLLWIYSPGKQQGCYNTVITKEWKLSTCALIYIWLNKYNKVPCGSSTEPEALSLY